MLYICLVSTIVLCGLVYLGSYIIENPDTAEGIKGLEIETEEEAAISEVEELFSDYTVLDMVQEAVGASGVMAILCAAILQVLVIEDFESGFAKGIFSTYKKRWKYLGSKLLTGGIVSFIFLVVNIVACFVLNIMAGNLMAPSNITDIVFYGVNMWLLLNAFIALILLICVAFRSKAISIIAEIVLGLGLIVSILQSFLGLFDLDGIMNYSLFFNMGACPVTVDGFQLRVVMVGLCFLIGSMVVSKLVLDKKDI
jgi:ABC-type transport system involved in multi-copper enzyme maturation permease subunit